MAIIRRGGPRAAWYASPAGGVGAAVHHAAADASAVPHRVLELQSLLSQGQPLQHLQPAGAATVQAAAPAQLPQSALAPSMDVLGRIAAAAAGPPGAVVASDLALWQQICQMVLQAPLASAAGHQSYPAVLQPGPAAQPPDLATTALPPAALLSPATLQPPSPVAQLPDHAALPPVTQPPPALVAAQCDAASTPLALQPTPAAIQPVPARPAAAAQLPAAQPPGLGSVLPASRPDPWLELDPWLRHSAQQPPPPAHQPAAQPLALPPRPAAAGAPQVAQPAAAAVEPDPWQRAHPCAFRDPRQPPPSQHDGLQGQRQEPPWQQAAVAQLASGAQERRLRSEARRALQSERLQDEWDRLEVHAMLAQRVEAGGETAIHEIARERHLEPGDVRKWHRAWGAAIAGPVAPSRW